MPAAICIPLIIVLALLALLCLHLYRSQRAAILSVLHLVSTLAQGQYARRTDPMGGKGGMAGELARAANSLAEDLEARDAQAQQNADHLVSLLALLDHTNEIAIATDNMDTISLVNAAAARVLERPADALLGKHIETVIHHPDLRALYRNAFSSSQPVSAQIALQTPGRTLHCQATAATIYSGPHYRGTLLVLRDVTEIARTLQMRTDFVANASHELRTPLAAIRAAVETIKEAGPQNQETVRRCVDIIGNHVTRLQLLVQDLLDLSRMEDSRTLIRSDQLDLRQICDAILTMYASQAAERQVQLRVELAPDARTFRGDERLITLTLKNLVDNAVKFTSRGNITIRSYIEKSPTPMASGQTAESAQPPVDQGPPPSDHFVLEVADTGIGIPPEDRQRVFERFYTVNRSRGGADRGTGLGLAIVKHAVNALHGTVSLTSEINQGTTLRCIFPYPNETRAAP